MEIYPITIPGGSDTEIQYNNGGIFGGDSAFVFDDVNKRVGIGVASPGVGLDVRTTIRAGASTQQLRIWDTDSGADEWAIGTISTHGIGFMENADNAKVRFAIIAGGNLGIGTYNPDRLLHLRGASALGLMERLNDNYGTGFLFVRKQANGDNAVDGDELGKLTFAGAWSGYNDMANVTGYVDGVPESGVSYPGKIIFATTPQGSTASVERLVIRHNGAVDVIGDFKAGTIQADDGWSGTFINGDGATVTVLGGIITGVV